MDGLWTVIFTKCVMLCFTWLTLCFWWFKCIFTAFYCISGSYPWLVSYSKGILIKKGLYCTLSCILFCTFLGVAGM
jgi:accessory gene regulator protein AgrB